MTQTNSDKNVAVAIYGSHLFAELAIKELQHNGVDMKKLSIVGRDYHTEEQVVGYYTTGDRMLAWGSTGAFWGGLWGFMFGAFFFIPGLGPILAAGPVVAWIVGGLEGAAVVGGLGALGAALAGVGIPRDSVLAYETQVKTGKYLVMFHGTVDEVERAKTILDSTNHLGITTHLS